MFLLGVGLVRICLAIFPYQFHACNHRLLSLTLIPVIAAVPITEVIITVFTCGNACDANTMDMVVGLYGQKFNFESCASPHLLSSIMAALLITYVVILYLEYKRQKTSVTVTVTVARVVRDVHTISEHVEPRFSPNQQESIIFNCFASKYSLTLIITAKGQKWLLLFLEHNALKI